MDIYIGLSLVGIIFDTLDVTLPHRDFWNLEVFGIFKLSCKACRCLRKILEKF